MERILRKYTDELLTLLIENNIDKNLLNHKTTKNEKGYNSFEISINNTPFYFKLVNSPDSFDAFTCSFILFQAKYPLFEVRDNWRMFVDIKPYFLKWIKEVKDYFNELTRIDLWEQLYSSSNILNLSEIDFDDKTNFNYDELQQIKLSINDLKLLISREFNLQDDERIVVNDRLDYLTSASERLNRYDWKGLLISTMINISVALSLDTTKGQALFLLFKKVFSIATKYFIGN